MDFRRPDVAGGRRPRVLLLLLLVMLSREKLPRSVLPLIRQKFHNTSLIEGLNITDEMLSPHSLTRQIVDQISLAKAVVIIAKDSNNLQFAAELSAQIRKCQALLSNSATMATPLTAEEWETAIHDMALFLYQAQQLHYDSATMIMKMRDQFQSLNEKMKSEAEKNTKYGQIAAEELPKGLYCLGIRLTMEWFGNPNLQRDSLERKHSLEKLRDNSLYHYCIFSDNILATSVVVNSTSMNSKNPDKIVFHLVTDEMNYAPMKAWFSMNNFRGATIEVQKVEDFSWLNASYVPVLKQLQNSETQNFYFSGTGDNRTPIKFRNPKYLSMLNHLRFYIPEVYPALQKVVFLDDDVVVQKDLSKLFTIDLNGNAMGAVETCMETFHRFHKYLNFSHPLVLAKKNVTGIYHYWQERNADHTLWKLGTLPPGLLAFYGLVEKLDAKWHVLGLGYTNVDPLLIKNGAVLHYNGNMKPWLKIGMEKYKGLWDKYVDYSHPLLQQLAESIEQPLPAATCKIHEEIVDVSHPFGFPSPSLLTQSYRPTANLDFITAPLAPSSRASASETSAAAVYDDYQILVAKDMILNGCVAMKPGPCKAINYSNMSYFSHDRAFSASLKIKNLCAASQEFDPLPSRGRIVTHFSSVLSSFQSGHHSSLSSLVPVFPKLCTSGPRHRTVPRASKDVPVTFRYPPMTKKPRWWWRALACIPYLMPLHETWMYAETAFHLHPFLEDFKFLTYPFLGSIGRLPSWFLMAYFFAAYLGVVRRKEWPHFVRFHVVMGMLLEIALQVIGTVSRWMPLAVYWGKIGMHFWTAVSFGYLFTVLECMRCALGDVRRRSLCL
ncbi:Glycosyl transferase family 8 [Musa troglodytarum]|uniref:Glycosyl transferase family 8 n=1 Tax=Musa troglodytarum TaxID=320322 RepID=A0A9E7GZV5_9LILI|nr:Glycosyl transferase family 8 [Musa troglodytarum]